MYSNTSRLNALMQYYHILELQHGKKEDKLGDVYEDYCVQLFSDNSLLNKFKANRLDHCNTDDYIFGEVFSKNVVPYAERIYGISATRNIQPRITGGNPKTDVIVDIETDNGIIQLPISIKQTTAPKVAMAEFDVNTIVREIGITDRILIGYLEKHQHDASAKNFTDFEKDDLTARLRPYVRQFVRWVVTGTPVPTDDLRFPDLLIKFSLSKQTTIDDIVCYTVDEYVNSLIIDRYGNPKKGGFGTGLGWTYATGSKGSKIQFKG